MTEDEAKTKICCGPLMVSQAIILSIGAASGAPVSATGPARCISSACMAWRVMFTTRGPIVERRVAPPLSDKPDGDDWGYESRDPRTGSAGGEWVRWGPGIPNGFCGLAGAPQ